MSWVKVSFGEMKMNEEHSGFRKSESTGVGAVDQEGIDSGADMVLVSHNIVIGINCGGKQCLKRM